MAKVTPLEGVAPKPPVRDITSFEYTDMWARGERYNPDALLARKGSRVYDTMMLDEQVKAVVQFKRDAVISRGWSFKFDNETDLSEDEQKLRTRVFQEMISKMRGSFEDVLNGISQGRIHGYSLTEKVFDNVKIDGKTYLGPHSLWTRDPSTFIFHTDEYGLLKKCVQKLTGREIEIKIDNFIHYVHCPEYDRYYGQSDLRQAYRAWYVKDQVIRFYTTFLERFAGGFGVLKMSPEANIVQGSPSYTALQEIMRNLRSMSGILLPAGVEFDVVMPSNTGEYREALQYFDQSIAKSLLVPNLLGVSHTGQTGSYAQSQTQLEAFFWTLNADTRRLEACLNEQLFRHLGDVNWGDNAYPQFAFNTTSADHTRWIVDTWAKLISAEAVIPTEDDEAHLRTILDMPKRTGGEVSLQEAKFEITQATMPEGMVMGPDGKPMDPNAKEIGSDKPSAVGDDKKKAKPPVMHAIIDGRRVSFEWDESKIKREPKGQGDGGQFDNKDDEALQDSKVPPEAKDYAKAYLGYDPTIEDEEGNLGNHVFEFESEDEMEAFMDDVGGAPHPEGGNRVILEGKRIIDPHIEKAKLESASRAEKAAHRADTKQAKSAALAAKRTIDRTTEYESSRQLLKPDKMGVEQREAYKVKTQALHDELISRGYNVVQDTKFPAKSEIERVYQGPEDWVEVSGRARRIEARPGDHERSTNTMEFLINVRRGKGNKAVKKKSFAWDESKVKREPKGQGDGGQFANEIDEETEGLYGLNSKEYVAFIRDTHDALPDDVKLDIEDYASGPGPKWRERDARIEAAIEEHGMTLPSGYTIYRGLSFDDDATVRQLLGTKGAQLVAHAIQSTTPDYKVASEFAGLIGPVGVMLEITPADNVKVLPVAASGQNELVLPKATRMTISAPPVKDDRGIWRVHVRASR